MSIVRVKTKYQVTIPTAVRERAGISIGDVLEASVERGKITLAPKTIVDRGIVEGLEDLRKGKVYGPFDSAESMLKSLHANVRKLTRKKTIRPK